MIHDQSGTRPPGISGLGSFLCGGKPIESLTKEAHHRPPTAIEVQELVEAPEMNTNESDWVSGDLDQAVIKRSVKRRKGSWYQISARLGRTELE